MKIYPPIGVTTTNEQENSWREKVARNSTAFNRNVPLKLNFGEVLSTILPMPWRDYLATNDCSQYSTPMWNEHLMKIYTLFSSNRKDLLLDDLVRYACYLSTGGAYIEKQIAYLESKYTNQTLHRLLKEDVAYLQDIAIEQYETSESRLHHLTHLAVASESLEELPDKLTKMVEFGAGYGSMTSLLRRLNPSATQLVVDFPVMLLVQAYYLRIAYPEIPINFVRSEIDINIGGINLIPISAVPSLSEVISKLGAEIFIATFSLSEGNAATKVLIQDTVKFFNARSVLYAYRSYKTTNARQPESIALSPDKIYKTVNHITSFWSKSNEFMYQIMTR